MSDDQIFAFIDYQAGTRHQGIRSDPDITGIAILQHDFPSKIHNFQLKIKR
jgi:hypothetical protein